MQVVTLRVVRAGAGGDAGAGGEAVRVASPVQVTQELVVARLQVAPQGLVVRLVQVAEAGLGGEAGMDFTDTDADGVSDGLDNCRELSNPDQADGDYDRIGDACDANRIGRMYSYLVNSFC